MNHLCFLFRLFQKNKNDEVADLRGYRGKNLSTLVLKSFRGRLRFELSCTLPFFAGCSRGLPLDKKTKKRTAIQLQHMRSVLTVFNFLSPLFSFHFSFLSLHLWVYLFGSLFLLLECLNPNALLECALEEATQSSSQFICVVPRPSIYDECGDCILLLPHQCVIHFCCCLGTF